MIMKKIMSVLLVMVTFSLLIMPSFALAASVKMQANLVTNVVQSAENKVKFTVTSSGYGPVEYSVFWCGGTKPTEASFKNFLPNMPSAIGKKVSSGNTSVNKTVNVTIPYVGWYCVTAKSLKGLDYDFILIKFNKVFYSKPVLWTPENINRYVAKELFDFAVPIPELLIKIVWAPLSKAYAALDSVSKTVKVVSSLYTDKYINEVPSANKGWRYKFVPNQTGYKVYLEVIDFCGNVLKTYDSGTIALKLN